MLQDINISEQATLIGHLNLIHDNLIQVIGTTEYNYLRSLDDDYLNSRLKQLFSGKTFTVILSDGDVVFQPRKVQCSGLWEAVEGRVLIYIHKEQMLDDVERIYPAHHYVMVDDKLRILSTMKRIWGERLTTVLPRQGHYAFDPKAIPGSATQNGRSTQPERSGQPDSVV